MSSCDRPSSPVTPAVSTSLSGGGERFLSAGEQLDPHSQISLPDGENVDYEARIAEAKRIGRCAECSGDLDRRVSPRSAFCSPRCRYRFRDRRRYLDDPERQRERARAYYAAHREEVLAKASARRGRSRPTERSTCAECETPLTGRQRVTCGSARCRDLRFARLHPESYAERERRKVKRRRERRAADRT